MQIKRRDLLIVLTIWLCGCGIVAGLLGVFYWNNEGGIGYERPIPANNYEIASSENTAKSAYLLAVESAQAWHEDVELVAISTQWTAATLANLGQIESWSLRFYSPKSRRIFFARVVPNQEVQGRGHLNRLKQPALPINPESWMVDSDEALQTWANNGGGTFLEKFPGSQVEVLLHQDPDYDMPVWDIIGINADQLEVFYLSISASNGDILK